MNKIQFHDELGKEIYPTRADITVTSAFPHLAVVDVTIALSTPVPHTLTVTGHPSVPSLRLLSDGVANTEFEIASTVDGDVTSAKLIVHNPLGARSLTMQWHTSFVPIDGTRYALPLPSVETDNSNKNGSEHGSSYAASSGTHAREETQFYRVALDWGTCKPRTDIVDRAGYHLISSKSGPFDTSFDFDSKKGGSLAVFVNLCRVSSSSGGFGERVASLLSAVPDSMKANLIRTVCIWFISAFFALIATYLWNLQTKTH